MNVLAIINNLVEETELIGTVTTLKRAGINTCLASYTNDCLVTGSHGVTIKADYILGKIGSKVFDYDALFFPGGAGSIPLKEDKHILEIARKYHKDGKPLFAICAAPSILGVSGILDAKEYTCYPSFERFITNGIHIDKGVVKSGNIITAKSVYFVTDFALEIIELLVGTTKRKAVETSICKEV